MTALLVIFFLILLNGVFAMAEIAMLSSRKPRLKAMAKKGSKSAQKALDLSSSPSKLLSTVQIGITLIGIFTGIYSGDKIEGEVVAFFNRFEFTRSTSETLAILLILNILTYFSLVLGELVPKRIALIMPEKLSRLLAYPMYWMSVISAPFIWCLSVSTDLIIKVLHVRKPKESNVTEEEIKAMIEEGKVTGVVQEIEQDIVENVFYLGDRKINTLMTLRKDVVWINLNDPEETIKRQMTQSVHKSFPVCRGHLDSVQGIIFSKDLLNSLLQNESFDLEKNLQPAIFLTENSSAFLALEKFRGINYRVAIVVSELGIVQGLLTMNDLVDALVGDLAQQLHERKEIIPRADGTFLVDADLPYPEFTRYFEIEVSDDPALSRINSVAGLILHFGKKISHPGDKIQWNKLEIEIMDMDGKRIDKVLVRKL